MSGNKHTHTFHRQLEMLRNVPAYPRKISSSELRKRLREMGFKDTTLRTIQRDLERFAKSFPLLYDQKKPIGWSWDKNVQIMDIPSLTPHMAITFQIISEFSKNLLPMETVEFLKPYFSLSEKMLNSVTDNTLAKWPDKIRIINNWFQTIPPKQSEGILREIYTALLEERKVATIYRKRGAETGKHYEINPLGLVMKGSIFYLICTHAINPTLDDLRTFSLHRFESATVLDEHWTIPDGFDLDEQIKRGKFNYSDGSQIKVQFLFDKESVIHLREAPVSLDQSLTERQDGRILLEATIFDSEPMRWWLLGFGNRVEVLAPETLRNEIISSIDGMRDRYR